MEQKVFDKVYVEPALVEKAKNDPVYTQFLADVAKLVQHFGGLEAHVIGGVQLCGKAVI